jgi:hypothetical protein
MSNRILHHFHLLQNAPSFGHVSSSIRTILRHGLGVHCGRGPRQLWILSMGSCQVARSTPHGAHLHVQQVLSDCLTPLKTWCEVFSLGEWQVMRLLVALRVWVETAMKLLELL